MEKDQSYAFKHKECCILREEMTVMKQKIPYGSGVVEIDIPDDATHIEPKDVPDYDEQVVLADAMNNPVGAGSLEDFLLDGQKVLVIVNDGTRPTPTGAVLESLLPLLDDKDITVMVATGVHRGATDEELKRILGPTYDALKDTVVSHDARKDADMVYLGVSSNGTELSVNKAVVEADRIIAIGSVEPHYFAGYTGGRKAIMPGVASYRSIEMNHKMALDPRAKALALEGNPVHEDMIDVLNIIKDIPIYAIMTVMNKYHKVYAATAGDITDSFYAAIDKANEVFSVELDKKADIVLTVAKPPMDIDLYQSQKAIDNAKLALNVGGIMILVSSCRDGVGEESFYNLLSSSDTPAEVLERIKGEYKLGYHKAGKMAEVSNWADIWVISDLDDKKWSDIFIRQFKTVQEAIDEAIRLKGEGSSFVFMPDGCVTVPRLV